MQPPSIKRGDAVPYGILMASYMYEIQQMAWNTYDDTVTVSIPQHYLIHCFKPDGTVYLMSYLYTPNKYGFIVNVYHSCNPVPAKN